MKHFTVALLYSLKSNAPGELKDPAGPWDRWNELDSEKSVEGYERALREAGHTVIPLEGNIHLAERLAQHPVDICFNTCEGHRGPSREAQVPAILDMLGIPYTGSGVLSLAIALDKAMTKRVLRFYGIPTPAFQVFETGKETLNPALAFPLFAKPLLEGSGIGITGDSICRSRRELRSQVKRLRESYRQPVLVEEYIEGREITMGLIGNVQAEGVGSRHLYRQHAAAVEPAGRSSEAGSQGTAHSRFYETDGNGNERGLPAEGRTQAGLRVLPAMEVDFGPVAGKHPALYNSEIKANDPWGPSYLIPAPIPARLTARLARLTVGTFRALECRDFCRVDFRVRSSDSQPFVLEINPLAGLTEGSSDLVLEANAAGMSYSELVNGILEAALARYGMI